MNALKDYFDIDWLLEHESIRQDRAQNREDGLESEKLKHEPYRQLVWWMQKYRFRIQGDVSGQIEEMLGYLSWTIIIIMFFVGLGTGSALLEYGGGALVNIVSFFMVLVAFPLLLSLFSLLFLLRGLLLGVEPRRVPLPVRALLDLFGKVSQGMKERLNTLYRHEKILSALGVTFLQYGSIALSVGALSALMIVITTQDIAFGWNTTLDITAKQLHQIVVYIAFPWSTWLPDAVPSIELIDLSRHFRLGNEIPARLIAQAKELGGWWQFLAMALLVWGVLVRVVLVSLARYRLGRLLRTTLLHRHDAVMLLTYMNEPFITTNASEEQGDAEVNRVDGVERMRDGSKVESVIGWNLDEETFKALLSAKHILATSHFLAGGKNSIDEDDAIIAKAGHSITILVKAWEPPLREFLDFISDLAVRKDVTLSVYPVGEIERNAPARSSDIAIWKQKIASLHLQNIGIAREAL